MKPALLPDAFQKSRETFYEKMSDLEFEKARKAATRHPLFPDFVQEMVGGDKEIQRDFKSEFATIEPLEEMIGFDWFLEQKEPKDTQEPAPKKEPAKKKRPNDTQKQGKPEDPPKQNLPKIEPPAKKPKNSEPSERDAVIRSPGKGEESEDEKGAKTRGANKD